MMTVTALTLNIVVCTPRGANGCCLQVLELQRKADEEVKLKLQEEEFIRHQAETVRELQAEAEAATYRHVQRPQRAAKAEL